jgi:hypothetical protein
MDLNLQPLAAACFSSKRPFTAGDRIVSYLVGSAESGVLRYDVMADQAGFSPPGIVACRWTHVFKPRAKDENPERTLKLSAENLFLVLADPATEPTPDNERLVRFLALMLERKKLLRARGRTADGTRDVYEHPRTKQRYEVASGEMTREFFLAVQEQLSVLVGTPRSGPVSGQDAPQAPAMV